jgi:poly-gamma-glutamate synthesis protein (capsule biosynthesis protein)
MTFVENNFSTAFVHYGLGNLFFDQMKPEISRQEFIDRHVFYDGQYLGVELLTALLEDYAQPRPMQPQERAAFLEKIFSLSQWKE